MARMTYYEDGLLVYCVLIFTKENATKRKNPRQLAAVEPRTGGGCNVDETNGTLYKKQAISCKAPKLRNGECEISAT